MSCTKVKNPMISRLMCLPLIFSLIQPNELIKHFFRVFNPAAKTCFKSRAIRELLGVKLVSNWSFLRCNL